jgi:hypothetical protein
MRIDMDETIDRMGARLYNQPVDRHGLANIATVLVFVTYGLRSAANELDACQGPTRRTWALYLAAAACERRLRWLGSHGQTLTEAEIVWLVDRVLKVLAVALNVLEAQSADRRRREA